MPDFDLIVRGGRVATAAAAAVADTGIMDGRIAMLTDRTVRGVVGQIDAAGRNVTPELSRR